MNKGLVFKCQYFSIFELVMLKRCSIITLLLLSYAIVLAHSIIPHHHHDDHKMEQSSDHHHHPTENNDSNRDEGLAHQFGNYMHSVNSSDIYPQPETLFHYNTAVTVLLTTHFTFKIKAIESPPPTLPFSYDCIPLVQHYLSSKGLRAPPYVSL